VTLSVDVFQSRAALPHWAVSGWWTLSAQQGLPYASPAWILGMWEARRDSHEELVMAIVHDNRSVVGVGAFTGCRGHLGLARWRVAGDGVGQRVEPLTSPGAEKAVAAALGELLVARASEVRFDAICASSRLPALVAGTWPARRRPQLLVDRREPGLLTTTSDSFERWRQTKSRNHRSHVSRRRRAIDARGGVIRRSKNESELEADLDAMFRLHQMRFAALGRVSRLHRFRDGVARACLELLARTDGARLWVVDDAGTVVAAHLYLWHGSRMCLWNGGFDPAWGDVSPGVVLYDEGIRDAHELGADIIDWGAGDHAHKHHVADAEMAIHWKTLLVRDARYPVSRLSRAPRQARQQSAALAGRLPPDLRRRIRRAGHALRSPA
jgi:CelD/BcsL family acetyltransferase involved in cellulose biosynthesis